MAAVAAVLCALVWFGLATSAGAQSSNAAPNTEIDTSPPTSAPGTNMLVAGVATDDTGVDRVLIVIWNEANQTWDGQAFTGPYTRVPAVLGSPVSDGQVRSWTYSFRADTAGSYVLGARASDIDGAWDPSAAWATLQVDGRAPESTFAPVASTPAGQPVTLTGTADDDWAVDRVAIVIYNTANHTWDGSSFTSRYTRVNAELDPSSGGPDVAWTYTFTPPVAENLVVGARAYDRAWKQEPQASWRHIDVTEAPPATTNVHIDCTPDAPVPSPDGSSGAPYGSVQAAIDEADAFGSTQVDWVLFKRGTECADSAPIRVVRDGARIGAYGAADGPRPSLVFSYSGLQGASEGAAVYVNATDVEIHELELRLASVAGDPMVDFATLPAPEGSCMEAGADNITWAGYNRGVYVAWGASNVTVNYVDVSGFHTGVGLVGDGNQVTNSVIHENTMMDHIFAGDGTNDDSGAFGVLINGSDNVVRGNAFYGHLACSRDYGLDGAAVELFALEVRDSNGELQHAAASNNLVEQNVSWAPAPVAGAAAPLPDHHFSELGSASFPNLEDQMTGNAIVGNTYVSDRDVVCALRTPGNPCATAIFVVTRGTGSMGPVRATSIVDNTVTLTGTGSKGVVCDACEVDTVVNIEQVPNTNPAMCAAAKLVEANALGYSFERRC